MYISFTNPAVLWILALFPPLLALPFIGRSGSATPRRWLGIGLRSVIGLGLVLSLAGAQLLRPVDDIAAVFVLDLSDSVPPLEQERAKTFIRQAIAAMPKGAQSAIVAFGEDALVERLASEAHDLPPITSVPRSTRTDLAAALRLGMALFPEESQKRLVVLSDGLENVGDALEQAELAAMRNVEIDIVPLTAPSSEQEAYLNALEIPAAVRQGQSFDVLAVIESSLAQEATLHLLGDGTLLSSRTVSLEKGTNRVRISLDAAETGFHRYHAELAPQQDTLPQNNQASGFSVVYGPPQVLIAAGEPGEADALHAALESSGVEATLVDPHDIPGDLSGLSSYDAVVLVDVPAAALSDKTMEALPAYVRELGKGLVMIGGEHGYGAGGYLRTPLEEALPVDMEIRSRSKDPNLAVVLVIDKSGSMGRCHCDDPTALPGEYESIETGLAKVEIAKSAIMMATDALGSLDYLGVVAFDENAIWSQELQPLGDAQTLQNAIGGMQAEGGTNIWAGLFEAENALQQVDAKIKHIILLTDGWSNAGDYDAFIARLSEEGITLSTIAAGSGSAEYLETLSEGSGGRHYPAPSITELPQIFFHETVQVMGSYIIEEAFYALPAGNSPILQGLDPAQLPALLGYNGTTPKASAHVSLVSPRGDPILAQWQYGLGRAVAWTSDLKGQWASDWVSWAKFNAFTAQMVNWALPVPFDENLQVNLSIDGSALHIQVDATDEQGQPQDLVATEVTLIAPDLSTQSTPLEQSAAGHYEGHKSIGEPGTYLLQVVQRDAEGNPIAQQTAGLIVPYSPEYKRATQNANVLYALAQKTAGDTLETIAGVFVPTQQPASRAQPLWPTLLLIAALLFPLDVAVRRLKLTPADWQHLSVWLREHLPNFKKGSAPTEKPAPVYLSELYQAKARAQRREARPTYGQVETEPVTRPHSVPSTPAAQNESTPEAESEIPHTPKDQSRRQDGEEESNTLARLRAARNRARKRR